MPLYEYHCKDCQERFARTETMLKHTEHPHLRCPQCKSSAVEPVFSPFFAKTVRKS